MTPVVLAVDQGSSSSRCLALSARASGLPVLGAASAAISTALPHPGWVEHDPDEIIASVRAAMSGALAQAGVSWTEVAGIGLAVQTETFVVWERGTGRPVYPAVSWRDGRAAEICARLDASGHGLEVRQLTGLPLQPAFTAPKLRWLLDSLEAGQRRAEAGELLFGDVACWLIWKLSGGAVHVTEPSLASRTMLFGLGSRSWHAGLLSLFDIPEVMLPQIRPTAGYLARTDAAACGGSAVITAAAGDQQAALFGQGCFEAGQAKLTLGTGAFLWCQAGPAPPVPPPGVVASCAWQLAGNGSHALEGFVPTAGSITPWLRGLGTLGPGDWPAIRETALRRAAASAGGGLWCVPALYGLGTPDWWPGAAADLYGMTASSTAADISEAALLGVAQQIADAIDAVAGGLAAPLTTVRVDGGMSRNDSLVQAVADLSGVTLERTQATEATALGAGALAGVGSGAWDLPAARQLLAAAAGDVTAFRPGLAGAGRAAVRQAWRSVRDRALAGWAAADRQEEHR